jgi:hypothetical protein
LQQVANKKYRLTDPGTWQASKQTDVFLVDVADIVVIIVVVALHIVPPELLRQLQMFAV